MGVAGILAGSDDQGNIMKLKRRFIKDRSVTNRFFARAGAVNKEMRKVRTS